MPMYPSAPDELLRLTGTANGTHFSTLTTTTNGTGAYYGANRTFTFQQLVNAVSGTSPTLVTKFQDSADGTTYTDIGVAFPQVTTTQVTATGSISTAFPTVALRTADGRPYLRVVNTLGGTSPSVSVAVLLVADPAGVA